MTMKVFEPASGPEIVESQEYHGCNKQNSEIENVQEFSWTIGQLGRGLTGGWRMQRRTQLIHLQQDGNVGAGFFF